MIGIPEHIIYLVSAAGFASAVGLVSAAGVVSASAVLKTAATALIALGTSPPSFNVMARKRFLVTLLAFQTDAELSSR